ncbi:helix-turn-helix domain-containing protein [Halomonas colorata]|uniref:helix-turn-helix domain-containing protein n=1 Tax=Halomonas colorata TaxID=2742615 RepID=UPI0018683506|nr:helix-turn-helix domain-containing protein [Halomonas colorata]
MSLHAMHWARQSLKTLPSEVKAPARLALMLLADYADEQHTSWPSINTMALEMGCSVRSVQRAIDLLEQHGLVRVESRQAKNGRQMSNRYFLAVGGLFVGCQSDTPTISAQNGEGDNMTPTEGVNLTGKGVTGDRGRVSPVSPLDSTNRTLPLKPTLTAGEAEPTIFERAARQADDGEPAADPMTSPRKTAMTLDWEPDQEVYWIACYQRGLAPDANVFDALADFREHFAAQSSRTMTHAEWTRRFARWVAENAKRQQAQQTTVATSGGHHASRRNSTPKRRLTAQEARAAAEGRAPEPPGQTLDGEWSSANGW